MTSRCDGNRPEDRKGEQKVTKTNWDVTKIPAEMRAVMTVYAGCIEGPRVTFATIGNDRNVLASGSADTIAKYAIGEAVKLGKDNYQRNIGRKQEDTVGRLKDEMKGTGEFQGKGHNGYTITVNGQLVTADSVLNGYFSEQTAMKDNKPVVDAAGQPIKFMGGVEMIVSAIIKPGSSLDQI